MKYEMIFGDEGLFFDAQKDCEMVGNGHHKVENGKLMVWNFSEKHWAESHTNKITIAAMRRIIKEPKRWTWEDKKSGRLPEVGGEFQTSVGVRKCVITEGRFIFTVHDDDEVEVFTIDSAMPIETPEEKAQREEDEFVDVIVSEYNKMPSSVSFKVGIRAAYRKLKGGE